MRSDEFKNLAAYEDTHWWFVSKRRLVKQCLQQHLFTQTPERPDLSTCYALDIGCGAGANLAQLRSLIPTSGGFDFSPIALMYARREHAGHLGQADISHLPLSDNSVDLITVLDVLYHQWIPDDGAALAEVYRVLKPGGLLVLTAPAYSFLRGPHDVANLTARRYTLPKMRARLVRVGFEVRRQSYAYAVLFPIALARRWWQRIFSSPDNSTSDLKALPAWLNSGLVKLFSLELAWLKYGALPWGSSILFVVQKPDS